MDTEPSTVGMVASKVAQVAASTLVDALHDAGAQVAREDSNGGGDSGGDSDERWMVHTGESNRTNANSNATTEYLYTGDGEDTGTGGTCLSMSLNVSRCLSVSLNVSRCLFLLLIYIYIQQFVSSGMKSDSSNRSACHFFLYDLLPTLFTAAAASNAKIQKEAKKKTQKKKTQARLARVVRKAIDEVKAAKAAMEGGGEGKAVDKAVGQMYKALPPCAPDTPRVDGEGGDGELALVQSTPCEKHAEVKKELSSLKRYVEDHKEINDNTAKVALKALKMASSNDGLVQALRREMRKNEKKMREQEEALSLANAPEATGETPTAGMTEEAYEEKLHYIIHIQCSVATLHLH